MLLFPLQFNIRSLYRSASPLSSTTSLNCNCHQDKNRSSSIVDNVINSYCHGVDLRENILHTNHNSFFKTVVICSIASLIVAFVIFYFLKVWIRIQNLKRYLLLSLLAILWLLKKKALWNWKILFVSLSNPRFETKLLKKTHCKLIATYNNAMAMIAKEAMKMKYYNTSCASWIIECDSIACIHHTRDFISHEES